MFDIIDWGAATKFLEEIVILLTLVSSIVGTFLAKKKKGEKELTEVVNASPQSNTEYLAIAKRLGKTGAVKILKKLVKSEK